MKDPRVQVGKRYYTHVSENERYGTLVEVIGDDGGRGRRYKIKRADNGKILDKRRAASALHDEQGPW